MIWRWRSVRYRGGGTQRSGSQQVVSAAVGLTLASAFSPVFAQAPHPANSDSSFATALAANSDKSFATDLTANSDKSFSADLPANSDAT